MARVYGGIEAGGSKMECVLVEADLLQPGAVPRILTEARIATAAPSHTLPQLVDFFRPAARRGELLSVGLGAFGPLDLDPRSPTFGYITTTPKLEWQQTDLCGEISRALGVPAALDTDVNAAALGEAFWVGANRGLDPLLYITVGTGVGVGVVIGGKPLHGLIHPEGGHAFIPHDRLQDPFEGVCPYHGGCFEGLASAPSLAKRWGMPADALPDDHPAWDLEAHYLAMGICNLIYNFSPQRIVLGGGVLQRRGLIERVRAQVVCLLNGYIQSARITTQIDGFIVSPGLGRRSGVLGAVALAVRQETEEAASIKR